MTGWQQRKKVEAERGLKEANASAEHVSDIPALGEAVLKTVAYGDLFDYPLTAGEIRRYLMGVAATESEVRRWLSNEEDRNRRLVQRDGFVALRGRSEIIDIRRRRMARAMVLWPAAMQYGQVISLLPFVRMVAVTGSLAVNNADANSDIDYFIVTESGRLWLCRAMVILVVRLAAKRSIAICPNYFLSESALLLQDQNLYAAREMAQMMPIHGMEVYLRMRRMNQWVTQYLPNAEGAPGAMPIQRQRLMDATAHGVRRAAEIVLRTAPGGWLENWEMKRKVRRFSREAGDESMFSEQWCKGHFDHHGRRALETFSRRWEELAQEPEDSG